MRSSIFANEVQLQGWYVDHVNQPVSELSDSSSSTFGKNIVCLLFFLSSLGTSACNALIDFDFFSLKNASLVFFVVFWGG